MKSKPFSPVRRKGNSIPRVTLKEIAPAAQVERAIGSKEVWHLSLEDVESNTGRIIKREFCQACALKPSKVWFDETNVLYSKLRPYLNKVVVPEETGAATSELIPLRPDPLRLDRDYLSFYLRGPGFVEFANRNTQGANLPRVSMKEFWKHKVPVPSLEEQRRIVARIQECLSRVEEMERLQAEMAKNSVAILDAYLREVEDSVSKNLVSLDRVLERTRNGRSPEAKRKNHNCSVLTLTSVQNIVLNPKYKKGIELCNEEQHTFRLSKGEVYISRANTIDLVGLSSFVADDLDEVITFPDLLIRLTPSLELVTPEYLTLSLRFPSSRKQIQERAIGSSRSMVKISGARLKTVKIPIPTLEQQKAIYERFHRFSNATMEMNSCAASDYSNLRNAILRQAFAGKL